MKTAEAWANDYMEKHFGKQTGFSGLTMAVYFAFVAGFNCAKQESTEGSESFTGNLQENATEGNHT